MGVTIFKLSDQISENRAYCPQGEAVLHSFGVLIHSSEDFGKALSKQIPLNIAIGWDISDSEKEIIPSRSSHTLLRPESFHLQTQSGLVKQLCGLCLSPSSLQKGSNRNA